MTTSSNETKHPHPISGAVTAGIAELWHRWNLLIDKVHATPDQTSREALDLYEAARIVALCLVSIRARHIDDLQPKVVIAAYYRGFDDEASHISVLIEASIETDMQALMPPLDYLLH